MPVVNIHRGHPFDVYIGRAGHGYDGRFGNPIRVGDSCPVCAKVHRAPGGTLACYDKWLRQRVAEDPAFAAEVAALAGKRLGCFCAPRPCHGRLLERVAWEINTARSRDADLARDLDVSVQSSVQ